jgi:hypothetical protein
MDDNYVRSYHGRPIQFAPKDMSVFYMWRTRPCLYELIHWPESRSDVLTWIQTVINHLLRYRQNGANICCLPEERVQFIHRHYGSLLGAPEEPSRVIDHIHATMLDLARRRIDIHSLDQSDIHKIATSIFDSENPLNDLYTNCLNHPPFAKCPICSTRQISPQQAHPIYVGQCCICNPYLQVDGVTSLFGNLTIDPDTKLPDLTRQNTPIAVTRPFIPSAHKGSEDNWS